MKKVKIFIILFPIRYIIYNYSNIQSFKKKVTNEIFHDLFLYQICKIQCEFQHFSFYKLIFIVYSSTVFRFYVFICSHFSFQVLSSHMQLSFILLNNTELGATELKAEFVLFLKSTWQISQHTLFLNGDLGIRIDFLGLDNLF